MPNNFFKHNDKVYSENLNDGILVGNCFDVTLGISLPSDTGGVFPSTNDKVKAKVADVTPTQNSNLSIGDVITNNTGSSQEYRLTVYPNFNRFGGFDSVTVTGDGCTVRITEKGESSPIVNNLNYNNLSTVSQLKRLKEYDIVVTIPAHKVCTGLNFVLVTTSNDGVAKINQNNVTGLTESLNNKQNTLVSGANIKTISSKSVIGEGNLELLDEDITIDGSTPYGDNISQALFNTNVGSDILDLKGLIKTGFKVLIDVEYHYCSVYYVVIGNYKIVTLYYYYPKSINVPTGTTQLYNIPSNWRPQSNITVPYARLNMNLSTNGEISVYNGTGSTANNQYPRATFTYIVNNNDIGD